MAVNKYDDGTRPPGLADGVTITSCVDGALYDAGERFLYRIYRETDFCAESEREVVEELVEWTSGGTFHVAVDRGEVFATARTTVRHLDELQIGQAQLTVDMPEADVCEFSSLTLASGRRGTGVIESIYRAAWADAFRSDATWLAALVDPWLADALRYHYQLPFRIVGEPKRYMGGDEVQPIGMFLNGDNYTELSERAPGFWDWVLEEFTAEEVDRFTLPDPRGVHRCTNAA